MPAIQYQNNFGTNLTSNVNAGDATSPLNSIPTVAAPFYLAFDATNINSHYEVVYVTSKTATNVNHANLSYAHTTAEEVRMILPSVFLNTFQELTEGSIINGKITPTVGSNNLTVTLQTKAGATPSATDPVFVMLGGVLRVITSALSVTKNAGTNWCNSGSTELATKEIDYFVYLGYNATDGVTIGFSRYPGANQYSDFSVTTTNEKYCAISTITNAASTDYYDVIGRFAATLSAGAGYTWTVPTFTAINLIQGQIYETRWLNWLPAYAAEGSMTFNSVSTQLAKYKLDNDTAKITLRSNGTTGGSASVTIRFTLPMIPLSVSNFVEGNIACCRVIDGTNLSGYTSDTGTPGLVGVGKYNNSNWGLGAGRYIFVAGEYPIK